MAYSKDQWVESFEGQLSILRPHLTPKVLSAMSLPAWLEFGAKGEDPIHMARELSKLLDQRQAPAGRK